MTPQDQSYRTIPLTQGQVTIVDAADYEWLSQWKWHALWDSRQKQFKAVRSKNNKTILMHRELLGLEHGDPITGDHENGDTLDNRRQNLRRATSTQNTRNQGVKKCSTVGFKGVTLHKPNGMWRASIRDGVRRRSLGYFRSKEAAALAYDAAAKELHGEFAFLNFRGGLK